MTTTYQFEAFDLPPALQPAYVAAWNEYNATEQAPGLVEGLIEALDGQDARDRLEAAAEHAHLPVPQNIATDLYASFE